MNHHAIADSLAQRAEASADMHDDEHAQTLAQLAQAQAMLALDDVAHQLVTMLRELGPAMAALSAALIESDDDADAPIGYFEIEHAAKSDEVTR